MKELKKLFGEYKLPNKYTTDRAKSMVMHHALGYSIKEISIELDINIATVRLLFNDLRKEADEHGANRVFGLMFAPWILSLFVVAEDDRNG